MAAYKLSVRLISKLSGTLPTRVNAGAAGRREKNDRVRTGAASGGTVSTRVAAIAATAATPPTRLGTGADPAGPAKTCVGGIPDPARTSKTSVSTVPDPEAGKKSPVFACPTPAGLAGSRYPASADPWRPAKMEVLTVFEATTANFSVDSRQHRKPPPAPDMNFPVCRDRRLSSRRFPTPDWKVR